jgi:hypothetical protein
LEQSDDGERSCLSSGEGRSILLIDRLMGGDGRSIGGRRPILCVRCDGGSGSRSKIKDTLFRFYSYSLDRDLSGAPP